MTQPLKIIDKETNWRRVQSEGKELLQVVAVENPPEKGIEESDECAQWRGSSDDRL